MTELSISPDDIAEALRKHVESFHPTVTREEVGRVVETGDGIARVEGLPSAMALELLEFPGNLLGMALNLDVREIGCVVFGDASGIEEGDEVRRTGRVLSVPVGDAFLGRVVDPLGRPLTGKSAICLDTIINQRQHWGSDKQVKCIYVAVGQKDSTVREFVGALDDNGALEYTVVINAPAGLPASFKYIAPYSGS